MDGKTVWERVTEWWHGKPPEEKPYNPLNVTTGSGLKVDILEYRDLIFVIQDIVENKVIYGNQTFKFTDYVCQSTLEDQQLSIKVKVYPHDQPGRDLQILVMKQWDELEYNKEFFELLQEDQFDVVVDGEVESSFFRINGVKSAYNSQTKDGEVSYWDYWRKVDGEVSYNEFLFIEWDKSDTGRFIIWRGEEVPQNRISA